MKWIKHQTSSHTDAKLKRLILRQGMAGYGLYWYCLELIGKDVSATRLTFEIEEDSELLSAATGMTREQVESAMHTMVELGLFENVEGRITCLKMLNYIDSSMFKAGEIRDKFIAEKAKLTDGTGVVHVPYMDGTCTVPARQDRTEQDRTEQNRVKDLSSASADNSPRIPFKKIQDLWNEICVPAGLAQCKLLSNQRKAHIRQRHLGPVIKQDLEKWRKYFTAITSSEFMTGKNDRGWRADFDFAISERGITRTLEGKYHG